MRLFSVLLLAALATNCLCAQQQVPSAKSTTIPLDHVELAAAIRGSYYHPDQMSGLKCIVSVDWPAFFSSSKLTPTAERLKAIKGLNMQYRSTRGQNPDVILEWTNGTLDNREQFEEGLKQMLGGFHQMYWSLIASPPLDSGAEITKIVPLANGEAEVYSAAQDTKVVITVDKDSVPKHYTLDTPAMTATIDVRYVPPLKPVPGDLRRISGMDVSDRIGTTILNLKLDLDYQEVDGFYVPAQVSYEVGGAYSISMQFSSCSAFKEAAVSKGQ